MLRLLPQKKRKNKIKDNSRDIPISQISMKISFKTKLFIMFGSRRTILLCGFLVFIFAGSLFAGKMLVSSAQTNSDIELSQVNIEELNDSMDKVRQEIKDVQSKISDYTSEIKAQQKKARSLKTEMAIYENNIKKNELEIKETKLKIEEIELGIEDTKNKIVNSENRIIRNREILKEYIKLLYVYDQDTMFEVLLTKENISDFFNEFNATETMEGKIYDTIAVLRKEKGDLEAKEEELENEQIQHQDLIGIKAKQNNNFEDLKKQKAELLEVTKGQEKKFQQILEENKNILPSLKAKLHDLQIMGSKIKFADAFAAAKYIGARIGVRPAFLLGILKVESDMGVNVGTGNWNDDMYQCYLRLSKIAKTASRKKYYVKRAEDERNAYFEIVNKLGIDPNSVNVSREPTYGCGGAMGPAQFIPTTWLAHEEEVSDISGHYPPNPWDLSDAMAAMATKLSKVPGVTTGNYNAEYEAAGQYLGGANWRSKGLSFYPDRVMLYADLYSKELN